MIEEFQFQALLQSLGVTFLPGFAAGLATLVVGQVRETTGRQRGTTWIDTLLH